VFLLDIPFYRTAIPAVSFAGTAQAGSAATAGLEGIFDVRKFGAARDAKTLDPETINVLALAKPAVVHHKLISAQCRSFLR
jgi:hypothetical protein